MKWLEEFFGRRAPQDLALLPSAQSAASEVVCRHKELAWRMGPPALFVMMLALLGGILSSTLAAPCVIGFICGPRVQGFWYALIARWHLQTAHKIADPHKEDFVALALHERITTFFDEVMARSEQEKLSLEQLRPGADSAEIEALLTEVNDRLALIKSERERITTLTHDLRVRARSIGVRIKGTPAGLADLHAALVNEWALCLERLQLHHCVLSAAPSLKLLGR